MSEPTVPDQIRDVRNAVSEMRSDIDKKGKVEEEKFAKINGVLDTWEEEKQLVQLKLLASLKREEEAKARLDMLEAELARTGGDGKPQDIKKTDEYKALVNYVRQGPMLPIDEKALLRTDSDVAGGYLVPEMLDSTLLHKITEIDPIMAISDTRTVPKKTVNIVIESTIPTATYEGEAEAAGYSEGTYEAVELTCYRQQFTSRVTMDQLMEADWDMEGEMSNAAATAFAYGSGANFVTGTGFKTPEGFTVNAACVAGTRTSETNDVLTGDDVIRLTGDLKVGYDPVYVMNRATLAEIRTFKETNSGYLWQPGLNGPVQNTLCGYPYYLANSMADIGDGAVAMAFGDFRRGYRIHNRTGTAVLRDNTTGKHTAHVEFTWYRWNTGRVVLSEAIKLLTIQ